MLIHETMQIYRVRHPMPFEINHVNCYAIRGNMGWSLVDTGLNDEVCMASWQAFMEKHAIAPHDIKGIYCTHAHTDHFDLAVRLQQLSGAPVCLSADEEDARVRFQMAARYNQFAEILWKNDIPPSLPPKMEAFMGPGQVPDEDLPARTLLQPGETVMLGDFEFTVLLTPGHSDGHICLYNEAFGVLFSGDTILPEISPNIGLWPWSNPNPVKDYLNSLEILRKLDCKMALPAHGVPLVGIRERIDELKEIHGEKLARIKSLTAKDTTVYRVVTEIYGPSLDMMNLALAMGEVYAHLMYLYYQGELEWLEKDALYYFRQPRDPAVPRPSGE